MSKKESGKRELDRLKERLRNLEKHGEACGETLPGILGSHLANYKGFEDAEVFASVARICVGPYGIDHEALAEAWGCRNAEAISRFAMREGLPEPLARPAYLQALCVRFGHLTEGAAQALA